MSEVDIANMALSLIGTRSSITAFNDGSAEADIMNIWYASTRDSVLRAYNWGFARKQAELVLYAAAAGTTQNPTGAPPLPQVPWQFEYDYPADCLRARFVLPDYSTTPGDPRPLWLSPPWKYVVTSEVVGAATLVKILTNKPPSAFLVYTKKITDTTLFDSLFTDALAAAIAARIVIPLTGDKIIAGEMKKLANDSIDVAASRDENEGLTQMTHTPDWIRSRGYISDYGTYGSWYYGQTPIDRID